MGISCGLSTMLHCTIIAREGLLFLAKIYSGGAGDPRGEGRGLSESDSKAL